MASREYKIWRDELQRCWRWAHDSWPDDGLAIAGHGSARTREEAVRAAHEHFAYRTAIENLVRQYPLPQK
jgi:hypothetical protein